MENLQQWFMLFMQQSTNNNCKQALDRCTWRHDSILFTIFEHLKPKLANSFQIYVDSLYLELSSPMGLFSGKIPDIVLQQRKKLIFIEHAQLKRTYCQRVNKNRIVIKNLRTYLLFLLVT